MKKSGKIIIAALILSAVIISGVTFMLFNKDNSVKEITAFESLTLHFSGMRGSEEYEIIANGDKSEISYYQIKYVDGKDTRELQESATCDTQEVIDILNECKAMKWDGFHGKHPKGVLDGRMFNLTIIVNNGQKIEASGSQNFPKNFGTLENWITSKIR